jgi:two-component system, OmpR family, response regulator
MIRIAVIEDNPDLLDEVSFVLRHEHFQVTPCADGLEFDIALQQACFDVVVLDVGLPGEDGFSIARRIRQTHPTTGIVLMTARGDIADRIQGMEEGADAYLTKD